MSYVGSWVSPVSTENLLKPLTNLLKKHTLFVWTSEHQLAFDALKQALCSAPVLGILDFSQVFAIETDACQTGVGAVLLQNGHPLAYVSKPLGAKNQGLSTYEKKSSHLDSSGSVVLLPTVGRVCHLY